MFFLPQMPWFFLIAVLSLLGWVAVGWRLMRNYQAREPIGRDFARNPRIRVLGIAMTLAAFVLLALAAANPVLPEETETKGAHWVIALDVSESVLRADGGWDRLKEALRRGLRRAVNGTPVGERAKTTAGIVTFRDGAVRTRRDLPLNDLPRAISRLTPDDFAAGTGTDIEAGIQASLDLLEGTGKAGAVLLVTDGNATRGDALTVARTASRAGVPVHVWPLTAGDPELAAGDVNLAEQVHNGQETFLRGVLQNHGNEAEEASLRLAVPSTEGTEAAERAFSIPSSTGARFRWPLTFTGQGLRYVDLTLTSKEGEREHRRRFFTHVKRPPRYLSISDDHRWTNALDEEAEILTFMPENLPATFDFAGVDVAVLNEVEAGRLNAGVQDAIASAVTDQGLGLMVVNGSHESRDIKEPTVLMSYNDTPLEALLPVTSRPRPDDWEPPSRQVVILIDNSGSMSGGRLLKAKEIALHVVANLLRPRDRLDIITFAVGAQHLVNDRLMDPAGQDFAIGQIQRIESGGGTNPAQALALIGSRKMEACGMIFISDGEFGQIDYRPDCRATVFAIGKSTVPESSPLRLLADPFPVPYDFDPAGITIPYFEPREQDKFFEEGRFTPLSMNAVLPRRLQLPVPPISLNGAAITNIRETATLNAVRPRLTDPVLAYRENGLGLVGAFTSAFPTTLHQGERGRQALRAWLSFLAPFTARDHYRFQIEDLGEALSIKISLANAEGGIPDVDRITVRALLPDGRIIQPVLEPDLSVPGAFNGRLIKPSEDHSQLAMLEITESGAGALPRAQRLPLWLPPSRIRGVAAGSEAQSSGTNRELLSAIAATSGGTLHDENGPTLLPVPDPQTSGKRLWPYFALAGALCYLCGVGLRRLDL